MNSAEIFTGCGGMALGLSRAGFHHLLMVERDEDACATVDFNRQRQITDVSAWPLQQGDVRDIDWSGLTDRIDLLAGGPPCQPFAIGGKKNGHNDARDMWPEAIRAVRETRPTVFVWENVRNLGGPKFRDYLDWVVAHLSHPDLERHANETHEEHLARLRATNRAPAYSVTWQLVNAADYGAAQVRWRIIIMGIRSDLDMPLPYLEPSHSRDRLLWDQWITRDYWKRHGLGRGPATIPPADEKRVAGLDRRVPPAGRPWVTVRDAISGLGEPNGENNHVFQQGARRYPGHTGSALDLPSKALKAGDHGVPGGENMMVLEDDSVRYFTMREAARLVGLPDGYSFPRSWTESMRQLGNAVPVPLGEAIGKHLASILRQAQHFRSRAA